MRGSFMSVLLRVASSALFTIASLSGASAQNYPTRLVHVAHPKDKAKLDALDHDKVLKKARRWFGDVVGAALGGHVDVLIRKMGGLPK
jgi:hypothetical protein